MSWNALGKGLVTAGVMGVVAPFRYLLITPALMNLLDENEMMAVVSHEVGHVKKKHLLLYLGFLLGLMIITGVVQDFILDFFLMTRKGLEMVFPGENAINTGVISAISIPVLLLIFIGYFRFIFGFFMRNFERQADGFCIESGIDPNYMISSFMKLGVRLGDDGKKSNWHHFNLSERIDFIKKGMAEPAIIGQHNRKVKRALTFFAILLILFTAVSYQGQPNLKRWAAIMEHQLESTPDDYKLYSGLGEIYFQMKEWEKAKKAYEYAIGLNYNQPETLNNLAWLLLTSEDESLRDPKRALKLAKDSVELREAAHTIDTLSEGLLSKPHVPGSPQRGQTGSRTGRGKSLLFQKAIQKNERSRRKKRVPVILIFQFKGGEKGFLRYVYLADTFHPFLSFFLFVQEFHFPGDIPAVAFGNHIFPQGFYHGFGDYPFMDGRLDDNFKQLPGNDGFHFGGQLRTDLISLIFMHNQGQCIHRLTINKDIQFNEGRFPILFELIVKRCVPLRQRF